ncbi:MAG TPA: polyprenyl synthetase family protein [Rhizomicrobium sp.]
MSTAEAVPMQGGTKLAPIDHLNTLLSGDMAAADRVIHERLGSAVSLIPDLARHLIDSGGKRLRPMLTLAAARICGYAGSSHVKLAASVEFIHTATLLHDDVVDASAMRRGKPAANIVWANKPTILVGDYLFSRAFQLMVETDNIAVLGILAGASAIIAEGEVMQLRSTNNLATTQDDYMRVVTAKTATLFSSAAEAGATMAGASAVSVAGLRDYGHNLGIAFQLIDDALDYSGRQAQMGKSVGDDFREAKVTLPVIFAYARADDEGRAFWERTIQTGPQHEVDLARAIAYVEQTGGIADTRAMAERFVEAACASLAPFPKSDLRETLMDVARSSVGRAT